MIIHNLKVTANKTIERLDHKPIVAKTNGGDQICFTFDSVDEWNSEGTLICYMFNGTPYGSTVIDKDSSGNDLAITQVNGVYQLTVDIPYQCITSEGYLYTGLSLFSYTDSSDDTVIPKILTKTSTALLSQPIQILKNGGLDELDVATSPSDDMLVRMKLFIERIDEDWFNRIDEYCETNDKYWTDAKELVTSMQDDIETIGKYESEDATKILTHTAQIGDLQSKKHSFWSIYHLRNFAGSAGEPWISFDYKMFEKVQIDYPDQLVDPDTYEDDYMSANFKTYEITSKQDGLLVINTHLSVQTAYNKEYVTETGHGWDFFATISAHCMYDKERSYTAASLDDISLFPYVPLTTHAAYRGSSMLVLPVKKDCIISSGVSLYAHDQFYSSRKEYDLRVSTAINIYFVPDNYTE